MADTKRRTDPVVLMAVAGVLGGLAGLVIWMITDAFVYLPVFLAIGLVTGIAATESHHGG